MNRLKTLLIKYDVSFVERVFNTTAGITGLGKNPFVSQTPVWYTSMTSLLFKFLPFPCPVCKEIDKHYEIYPPRTH